MLAASSDFETFGPLRFGLQTFELPTFELPTFEVRSSDCCQDGEASESSGINPKLFQKELTKSSETFNSKL